MEVSKTRWVCECYEHDN